MTGAAAQPRRLAVLALLVTAGERGVSREQLLADLWPDHDEERARHSLNQALYSLRRELGSEELFLGQQEVRLNPDVVTSDYADFREAIRAEQPERAIDCYGGPFLRGFHLSGAEGFGRWVDEEREEITHQYGRMLEAAARRAAARHDTEAAVAYLKKRVALDPLNVRVTLKLMETLAADGDVAAALQLARVYEALVKQELELPPDPQVLAFAARLRASPRPPVSSLAPGNTAPRAAATAQPREPQPVPGDLQPASEAGVGHSGRAAVPLPDLAELPAHRRRWLVPVAITLVALVAGWLYLRWTSGK